MTRDVEMLRHLADALAEQHAAGTRWLRTDDLLTECALAVLAAGMPEQWHLLEARRLRHDLVEAYMQAGHIVTVHDGVTVYYLEGLRATVRRLIVDLSSRETENSS